MYNLLKPVLFQFDPEEAHFFLKKNSDWLLPLFHQNPKDVKPSSSLCNKNLKPEGYVGQPLKNPIGLAAGFDKTGELVGVMHHLGFGFMEVGSVTALPYGGNPKPRIFRLSDQYSLVNRMGLPGPGVDAVIENLKVGLTKSKIPVGVNIASTPGSDDPIKDILTTYNKVKWLDIAYMTINVSCPNTASGPVKSRDFIDELISTLVSVNNGTPIFLKLSPDYLDFAAEVVDFSHTVDGYVCGNTSASSISRVHKNDANKDLFSVPNPGGVSGELIRKEAFQLGTLVAEHKRKYQVVIGCGGITDGVDAERALSSYADLVQIYTALVFQGPNVVSKICSHLATTNNGKKL